ncbi:MAG: serine/threonine-protein kinase [Pseudomonadota bacterium]
MTDTVFGLSPGDVIQNTYRIDKLLGEGGMGATFAGHNVATDHPVAIKVMTPEFARNKKALELFRRESSLLRTVQNEAVIRYETTLQDAQGRLFLVMEYIDGHPLAYYISKGARLDGDDVLKLGRRLAGGLAAIHKLGIVHRDVAPDNILVPGDDVQMAKLIDFGLASDTIGSEKSIIGDTMAGKFSYMAPEQLGLFGGKVTGASDVYALGLVLCRITGQKVPGEGMGVAAVEARREDLSMSGKGLDPAVQSTLEAMLRANPADRPTDLVALFDTAIDAHKNNKTLITPQPGAGGGDTPGGSKLPLLLGAGALVAAAAVVAVLLMPGTDGGTSDTSGGGSVLQAEVVEETINLPEPIQEVNALIDKGDVDSLNAAFGSLIALGRDEARPNDLRVMAYRMAAEMYDPKTYDAARSPFPSANPSAAARMYQRAVDLGATDLQPAIDRLSE